MQFKAFIKRFQFEYVYNVLRESFLRFPLSVICAACGAAVWVLGVHDWNPLPEDALDRMRLMFCQGLTLFTAAKLFAEGSEYNKKTTWILIAGCAVVIAGAAFLPDHFTDAQWFFGAALALMMIFAPYINRNSTEDSVWYFTYCNGVGLAIAGVSTFTLCTGASAIIGSLGYLFPAIEPPGRLYGDIWTFGLCFFGPIAFLYQIPKQFDFRKDECVFPKGVYFIANYLVVPLLLIYTFILYVYFAKIIALWELPKGNLAYMVTGFGAAGIAARLAVFPMRENGTVLLQQFYRYFFYLLLIPVGLLAAGIYTRISEYGVTEHRYAIALCLVWLTGLTLWQLLQPARAHLKHVPMSLCVLGLIASIGPWGAVSLSTTSQVNRLEAVLEKNGLLVDGKIVKATKDVPFAVRKDISGLLDYFHGDWKEGAIAHLVTPFAKEINDKETEIQRADCEKRSFSRCWWGYQRVSKIMKAWGMEYVGQWATEEYNDYISVRAPWLDWNMDQLTKVAPYDYVARFYSYYSRYQKDWSAERVYKQDGKEIFKIKFNLTEEGEFTVVKMNGKKEGAKLAFQLVPLLEKLHVERLTEIKEGEEAKLTLEGETQGLKAQLRISELRGKKRGGKMVLEHVQLTVLFSP